MSFSKPLSEMTSVELLALVSKLRRKLNRVKLMTVEGMTLLNAKSAVMGELESREGK